MPHDDSMVPATPGDCSLARPLFQVETAQGIGPMVVQVIVKLSVRRSTTRSLGACLQDHILIILDALLLLCLPFQSRFVDCSWHPGSFSSVKECPEWLDLQH
jgi:hypothetical protein